MYMTVMINSNAVNVMKSVIQYRSIFFIDKSSPVLKELDPLL